MDKVIYSMFSSAMYNLLTIVMHFNFLFLIKGKKDVAQVFNNILRRQIGTRSPTVEYICTKPEILFTLMSG